MKNSNTYIDFNFDSPSHLFSLITEIESHNSSNISAKQSEVIEGLEDTIFKYFVLTFSLKKKVEKGAYRLICIQGFLTTLSNNALIIKKLYNSGMHLQVQPIMRAQFEQLNTLFALLVDDNFFERFGSSATKEASDIISPKPVHTDKIMRDFMKTNQLKEVWAEIKPLKDYLYDEFSKIAHGNLFHIAFGSMDEDEDDAERLSPGIGGVSNGLTRMKLFVREMNNYSQFLWMFFRTELEKQGYIDKPNNPNLELAQKLVFLTDEKNT